MGFYIMNVSSHFHPSGSLQPRWNKKELEYTSYCKKSFLKFNYIYTVEVFFLIYFIKITFFFYLLNIRECDKPVFLPPQPHPTCSVFIFFFFFLAHRNHFLYQQKKLHSLPDSPTRSISRARSLQTPWSTIQVWDTFIHHLISSALGAFMVSAIHFTESHLSFMSPTVLQPALQS